MKNKRGMNRPAGSPALPGAGRPATKATIHDGQSVLLTQIHAGGVADLGSGTVTIETVGGDRLIKVVQADGTEIHILVLNAGETGVGNASAVN